MLRNTNIPTALLAVFLLAGFMLLLLPFSHELALHASSPLYVHLLYMFAHASLLHLLVNTWCMVTLINVLTPSRFLAAYLSAFWLSYIVPVHLPVLGFSVIIFWYYGFISQHLWRHNRFTLLSFIPIVLIGFFFPHIASGFHLLAFLAGMLWWYTAYVIARIYCFLVE